MFDVAAIQSAGCGTSGSKKTHATMTAKPVQSRVAARGFEFFMGTAISAWQSALTAKAIQPSWAQLPVHSYEGRGRPSFCALPKPPRCCQAHRCWSHGSWDCRILSQERRLAAKDPRPFFKSRISWDFEKYGDRLSSFRSPSGGGFLGSIAGKTGYNCRKVYQNRCYIVNIENKRARCSNMKMLSAHDLAEALIRMFGRDAVRQAKENAASNAQAGDSVSAKMWQGVADIVSKKLARGAAKPQPRQAAADLIWIKAARSQQDRH